LADAGVSKAEVRALCKHFGLGVHDKPASPCLASRIPYGMPITAEAVRMIERAEAFVHSRGIRECRVRHHGEVARIEVPPDQIARLAADGTRERLVASLREIGYRYVTIDLRGFRSGSLNEGVAAAAGETPPTTAG